MDVAVAGRLVEYVAWKINMERGREIRWPKGHEAWNILQFHIVSMPRATCWLQHIYWRWTQTMRQILCILKSKVNCFARVGSLRVHVCPFLSTHTHTHGANETNCLWILPLTSVSIVRLYALTCCICLRCIRLESCSFAPYQNATDNDFTPESLILCAVVCVCE